jgi:dipeptidyl aminopeptidase/acylaminoacyl peptidase
MAAIGHDLHAKGYDVLLFDLRGHGSSDPSRLTMGAREREDLRSVLAWALKEGYAEDRIGWLGHSMGGSTLLMEAEQNPKFRAVVIDSAYGNLPELLDRQLTEHSHLPKIFNPGILLAARFVFGVRTDNLIPIESAGRWGHRPLLLIHGTLDSIVPIAQAQKIVSAVGSTCETMILPDVEHVGAFNAARTQYIETVDHFFDRLLAR